MIAEKINHVNYIDTCKIEFNRIQYRTLIELAVKYVNCISYGDYNRLSCKAGNSIAGLRLHSVQ